ncbi:MULTISPECIES: DNA recombination protein RmuC [Flavobacteriaceae]|uniref:DNA recombination protein RmuC n=2 Tax=Flavobacteriaceae TaxID=49546 RepID=A0A4Y8AVU9_9FLAO|nr:MULTISPECIES: DNA recombination protein RmuC [Flavobacteriaceae]TEW76621.1 DNA recombination protein RmuC [Gramella jeungdoensis]GGK51462.1 DNA recombination protein RmuC [Lutibacter litoralis]
MNPFLIYSLIAALFFIIGYTISYLIIKNKLQKITSELEIKYKLLLEEKERNIILINKLNEDKSVLSNEKHEIDLRYTQKVSELKNLDEKLTENKQEIAQLQEKFSKDFELLASKILEEKSSKFTEQNKENIKSILNPLQEKIHDFEKKVENTHKESIDYHAALRQQIVGLKELNLQMSKETLNLTKALKGDSKTQGNWGELVLERVLEKSGLEKNREYFVQQSFTNADGKRILPDIVIHLPDNKKMIIDSKVSLTAYEQYVNAESTLDKEQAITAHINSLKRHITQLSEKNYQDIYQIDSPNFVLLFIPIEPAFAVALNSDNQLYNKAFEKNIVIVTPTTLLATLRTIDSMWNNEKQQRNAIEIALQATRLYDQFVNLTDDLIKVGNQLKTVQGSYDTSMKKLTGKGNLIRKVETIKKLGAIGSKNFNDKLLERALEDED